MPEESQASPFARWQSDDALEALHRAGWEVWGVEPAHWPPDAPQPRTHRQALTFLSRGVADPHLLLVFETPEDLAAWQLWLARYWKARPYLFVKDNLLLLVSRDLSPDQATTLHAALDRLGQ